MDTLHAMLDKIKETRSLASDNALAGFLGTTRASVSNWRHGRNLPDTVTCARIAEAANVPLARVLGVVGEARAISREEKAVWRRLATAAVFVFCVMGAYARPAVAAMQSADSAAIATAIHYAQLRGAGWDGSARDSKHYSPGRHAGTCHRPATPPG